MNNTPSRSKSARRRLLIVLAFAVVLVIFSYGWTATDIDLSVPQEPVRQQNVGNALRELLSPNVFAQEYDILVTTTRFVINCPEGFTETGAAEGGDEPRITADPACGDANEPVIIRGVNFPANSLARANWIVPDGERRIRQVAGSNQDNFVTGSDGTFAIEIEVPRIRASAGETHTIEIQARQPVGLPTFSATTGLALEKMIETLFLALIATTVSILPSAILSFLAAHNLMQSVRTPLGGLLVSFTLLPVGWLVGSALLGRLGMLVLNIGRGGEAAGGTAALVLVFGTVAATRNLGERGIIPGGLRLRAIANSLLVAVVTVMVIGLIGGLALLFGRVATEGLLGYLGRMIGSIGQIVELAMTPIAGVVGAFTLSSIGTTVTRTALKHTSAAVSHLLGGILGALAGAILLGGMASVGMVAAWMGLLTPVTAAGLAGSILPQVYRRLVGRADEPRPSNRIAGTALSWAGAVAGFVATFLLLNVRQALVEGALPPQATISLGRLDIPIYVLQAMAIGAVLGGTSGALAGTRANFPIGSAMYTVTRTILNALRSIEPLIMGLVFVIWVGIGPFAGVLALALHSVASLGKLYSEQIESIDAGPIEALESTGANRLQTIMYAVVPQIIPPYIAFTMYRWDINVRMSTIIGFVGGGGIGFLLQQQINLLRYRDAGVAVLFIAIVVSVLDYASAAIRQRYT